LLSPLGLSPIGELRRHGAGKRRAFIAFIAKIAITFILMTVILHVSNNPRLNRFTGVFTGALVATYITVEAPISGMTMNPARTLASAVPAQHWTALWVYFTAPLIGMLSPQRSTSAAAERAALHAPSCITRTTSAASSAANQQSHRGPLGAARISKGHLAGSLANQ